MLNVAHRPLDILDNVHLSEEHARRLRAIEDYDLWFISERVRSKGILSEPVADQAVTEFKKYMALVALGYEELGMHSSEVDEIWHNFILFTREYAEFCNRVCGHMIHHRPNTSLRPELPRISVSAFKDAYTTCFGPIPPIWHGRKSSNEIVSGDCDVVQAPPPSKFLLGECDSQGLRPSDCDSAGEGESTDDGQIDIDEQPICG